MLEQGSKASSIPLETCPLIVSLIYTVEVPFFKATHWEKKKTINCGGSGDPIFCFARGKILLSYTLKYIYIFLFNSLPYREKLRGDINLHDFALQLCG